MLRKFTLMISVVFVKRSVEGMALAQEYEGEEEDTWLY